jgi:WD40 repeat protein
MPRRQFVQFRKIHAEKAIRESKRADSAIATAGGDGTIRVWDMDSRQQRTSIRAHDAGVGTLALSPDGRRLVSSADDHLGKVWDARTGTPLLTLTGHTAAVQSVAYRPADERIASASGTFRPEAGFIPGEVKVWDAGSGRLLFTLSEGSQRFNWVAFSPDGRRLACGGKGIVAIVDADSGEQRLSFRAHDDSVVGLALRPDGRSPVPASIRRPRSGVPPIGRRSSPSGDIRRRSRVWLRTRMASDSPSGATMRR